MTSCFQCGNRLTKLWKTNPTADQLKKLKCRCGNPLFYLGYEMEATWNTPPAKSYDYMTCHCGSVKQYDPDNFALICDNGHVSFQGMFNIDTAMWQHQQIQYKHEITLDKHINFLFRFQNVVGIDSLFERIDSTKINAIFVKNMLKFCCASRNQFNALPYIIKTYSDYKIVRLTETQIQQVKSYYMKCVKFHQNLNNASCRLKLVYALWHTLGEKLF